jgi:hypothetical protein
MKNMGHTPSKDAFKSLEGYAGKQESEWKQILANAGLEINDQDRKIATFLQTDEVTGGFIRGIVTVCLTLQKQQLEEEHAQREALLKQECNK